MKISKNFSRWEFECPDGCGRDTMDAATLGVLEKIREHFGEPVHVNSGHRCPEHNAEVGGAESSQHLYGRAADIRVENVNPDEVADFAETVLGQSGGLGRYNTFTHVDTRTNGPARWDFRS